MTVNELQAEYSRRTGKPQRSRNKPYLERLIASLPVEVAVVAPTSALDEIRRMQGEGMSLRKIAAALEAASIRTPRGNVKWSPSSIQSLLGQRWN